MVVRSRGKSAKMELLAGRVSGIKNKVMGHLLGGPSRWDWAGRDRKKKKLRDASF